MRVGPSLPSIWWGILRKGTKMELSTRSRFVQRTGAFAWNHPFWLGFVSATTLACIFGLGFWSGSVQSRSMTLPPEVLRAAATHGSSTMAIATGPIDDDSEGIFFLDYISGDLQCWVYYPRMGTFGAKFQTNVRAQLPSGKNPEYLLVTGAAVTTGASSNTRPAACLAYVMDVHEGIFAAYGVPWNRSVENSGSPQSGALIPVGGGQIRAPIAAKK